MTALFIYGLESINYPSGMAMQLEGGLTRSGMLRRICGLLIQLEDGFLAEFEHDSWYMLLGRKGLLCQFLMACVSFSCPDDRLSSVMNNCSILSITGSSPLLSFVLSKWTGPGVLIVTGMDSFLSQHVIIDHALY